MKDEKQAKKMKVISNLTKKMDTVKQEMFNAHRYRQESRTLVDFEKKQRMCEYKHYVRPGASESTVASRKKMRLLYEYLWDLKILPLHKILRDSRKIVVYSEWLYFYRENEILSRGNDILRDCKKKNIIFVGEKEEVVWSTLGRILNSYRVNIEKVRQLTRSIKEYFNSLRRVLPEGLSLGLKNSPTVPIFLRRKEEEGGGPKKPQSYTVVEKYKQFLGTFKRCESKKSSFFKFTKTLNNSVLHQSFINCLKRIPPSRLDCLGVKDLSSTYTLYKPETEEIKHAVPLDLSFNAPESIYDQRIPLKFRIEYTDLFLGGIDPEGILSPPDGVFYPFDSSKLPEAEEEASNLIEKNLYGDQDV